VKYFSHNIKLRERFTISADEIINAKPDAVIMCPAYYYDFKEVLEKFEELGILVVLLGRDFMEDSNRWLTSVMVDAGLAGRMAAELIRSYLPVDRCAAVFIGNKDIDIHRKKAEGFLEEARLFQMKTIGVFETQDDIDLTYYLAKKLITENPDVGAVYAATGDYTGICKYIMENGFAGQIKVIGTDVIEDAVKYMEQGILTALIFQNGMAQGKLAVRTIYSYITEGDTPQKSIIVPPQVILRNNMKLYL
jgi:ABC-type sugar transport system substrate-binding protein